MKKIAVGLDEFCSNCMEWREYDEEGRCIVCKKIIKKEEQNKTINIDNYGLDGSIDEFEGDEF